MPTSSGGCHLPTQPRAVSSHPSAADAADDEDINCEISSLFVLATRGARQQELPGGAGLRASRLQGLVRGEDAGAEVPGTGSAAAAPGWSRAGADGRCAKAGDGHHPARWSLPAEHRPNLAEVRCELLPRLPPAAADAAGEGGSAAAGGAAKHCLLSQGPSEKWVYFIPLWNESFNLKSKAGQETAPKTKPLGL